MPANPEHEWGFTARGGPAAPQIDAARAKVLGGCSAHNATVAMRARPSDIRDWQRHGLEDWTIEDVDDDVTRRWKTRRTAMTPTTGAQDRTQSVTSGTTI